MIRHSVNTSSGGGGKKISNDLHHHRQDDGDDPYEHDEIDDNSTRRDLEREPLFSAAPAPSGVVVLAADDVETNQSFEQQQQQQQQQKNRATENGASGTFAANTSSNNTTLDKNSSSSNNTVVSKTGLMVLILLALQNCSKNLLMRYVMKDQPKFLTSTAVLGNEIIKLTLSTLYILFVQKRPLSSIIKYMKEDQYNTMLLSVPATAYIVQMSLEFVALASLSAAMFSVLVQTKLLFTATFAALVLRKKLKYIQVISLVLLTVGVMLCNLSNASDKKDESTTTTTESDGTPTKSSQHSDAGDAFKGIVATLGIAVSSGFASVYTEKVIKAARGSTGGANTNNTVAAATSKNNTSTTAGANQLETTKEQYGLAYTQVQLAIVSLVLLGIWTTFMDMATIMKYGIMHNFTIGAVIAVTMSAIGGLIVASVLKYADSVLKGYATACSVVLTGVCSMMLFGTSLNAIYFMGITVVVTAVLLYNGKDLDAYVCG